MIRALLVVQVTHAGYVGRMAIVFRPRDCFFLCLESSEYVVVILDDIIVYMTALRSSLWAGHDEDCSHLFSGDLPK